MQLPLHRPPCTQDHVDEYFEILAGLEDAYTGPTAKEFKYTKKLRGKPALMEWKYRCCERCARRFDRSREHHKPDRYKSKRKGR